MLESKIYYPENYEIDPPLETWVAQNLGDSDLPIFISYHSQNCIVPPNHLLIDQAFLDDGRLLRCNQNSPQSKGDPSKVFLTVQPLIQHRAPELTISLKTLPL
ncbi:MAG: hypothetical protein MUC48_05110 [Leptolyngbya sp. Prado105]|nr:hypothetical protein [Leptolyngbya sp. Prado105]